MPNSIYPSATSLVRSSSFSDSTSNKKNLARSLSLSSVENLRDELRIKRDAFFASIDKWVEDPLSDSAVADWLSQNPTAIEISSDGTERIYVDSAKSYLLDLENLGNARQIAAARIKNAYDRQIPTLSLQGINNLIALPDLSELYHHCKDTMGTFILRIDQPIQNVINEPILDTQDVKIQVEIYTQSSFKTKIDLNGPLAGTHQDDLTNILTKQKTVLSKTLSALNRWNDADKALFKKIFNTTDQAYKDKVANTAINLSLLIDKLSPANFSYMADPQDYFMLAPPITVDKSSSNSTDNPQFKLGEAFFKEPILSLHEHKLSVTKFLAERDDATQNDIELFNQFNSSIATYLTEQAYPQYVSDKTLLMSRAMTIVDGVLDGNLLDQPINAPHSLTLSTKQLDEFVAQTKTLASDELVRNPDSLAYFCYMCGFLKFSKQTID